MQHWRFGKIGAALAGGLVLVGGLPAAAQEAARMEAVERQIRSLQQELARIRREATTREAETREARQQADAARAEATEARRSAAAAPAAATAAVAQARPASAAAEGRLTFPGYRPTFTSADGRFVASVGAQVQYDIGGYLRDAPGRPNNRAVPGLDTFGQNLRRGRLPFSFRYDDVTLNLTPDFGGSPDGTPSLYEANLNWNPGRLKQLTVTAGYFKPWITLQDSMSSNDFLFLEKPSIVDIARSIAAGDARSSVGARWADNRWFASAYLTGAAYGSNLTAQGVPDQTGGVARLAGRPVATADMDVHLGVSGSYAFDIRRTATGQTLQLRDRAELRIDQSRLIDTGALNADKAWTAGPEFGVRWRSLMLQGEYIRIGVDQARAGAAPRPNLAFSGGYVEASWVITGEPRRYSTSGAAFGRPNPREPFTLEGGGWGAWEVAARWSVADLNDKVTRGRAQSATGGVYGGRQEVVGVGLSWYPNNLLRFMLNWDAVAVNKLNAAGTTQVGQRFHTVALRTQMAF